MTNVEEAILKTICYRDIFDYPLTVSEIHKFLVGEKANEITTKKYLEELRGRGLVDERDGFYFLAGKPELARRRVTRNALSAEKYERAYDLSQILKNIPWVKAVFATGALAAGNAGEEDDIDFMVVTEPNRVWLVRAWAYLAFMFKGLKRKRGKEEDPGKVCLNMFLSEGALTLPKGERNLFTAHEICLARPLWAKDQLQARFFAENSWVKEFFPNWELPQADKREVKEQRGTFSKLDDLARKIQLWYMESRRTRETVERDRIMFHPVDLSRKILGDFKIRFYRVTHQTEVQDEKEAAG